MFRLCNMLLQTVSISSRQSRAQPPTSRDGDGREAPTSPAYTVNRGGEALAGQEVPGTPEKTACFRHSPREPRCPCQVNQTHAATPGSQERF